MSNQPEYLYRFERTAQVTTGEVKLHIFIHKVSTVTLMRICCRFSHLGLHGQAGPPVLPVPLSLQLCPLRRRRRRRPRGAAARHREAPRCRLRHVTVMGQKKNTRCSLNVYWSTSGQLLDPQTFSAEAELNVSLFLLQSGNGVMWGVFLLWVKLSLQEGRDPDQLTTLMPEIGLKCASCDMMSVLRSSFIKWQKKRKINQYWSLWKR